MKPTDLDDLIDEFVTVEIGGRTLEARIDTVERDLSSVRWRSRVRVERNGREICVPETAIIS